MNPPKAFKHLEMGFRKETTIRGIAYQAEARIGRKGVVYSSIYSRKKNAWSWHGIEEKDAPEKVKKLRDKVLAEANHYRKFWAEEIEAEIAMHGKPYIRIQIREVPAGIPKAENYDAEAAKLLAMYVAAPHLLAALEIIDRCVADDQGGVSLGSYEMDIVRAAIAKARAA